MIARVVVMPKRVVNDPQGVTVKHGLSSLGFTEVSEVRVGKHIEVRLESSSVEEARMRVDEMCRKLLANGVIEDYEFEIEAGEGEVIPSPLAGEGRVGGPRPSDSGWPGVPT